MTEQEYQELRVKCQTLRKIRRTTSQNIEYNTLCTRRNAGKIMRDRIFFWEAQIKSITFTLGNCKGITNRQDHWKGKLMAAQTMLKTARENFKNF